MYIFKYMQGDDVIYRNGICIGTYNEFMTSNPDFPLNRGDFFEYSENGFSLINSNGHHLAPESLDSYQDLITAINNLGE